MDFYGFAVVALTALWAATVAMARTITPGGNRAVRACSAAVRLVILMAIIADVTVLARGHDHVFDAWVTVAALSLGGLHIALPTLHDDLRGLKLRALESWAASLVAVGGAAVLALRFS